MKKDENYMQQLVDYIKKNLSKGYTLESLKWALIEQGHSRVQVANALELFNKQMAAQSPKLVEKPQIKVETDVTDIKVEEESSLWSKVKGWFK